MSLIPRQSLTGTRTEAGTLVKGRLTPGSTSAINFTASVQPISGDELLSLPEGIREEGMFKLYTDFALRSANQTTKEPADKINLFGKVYKVVFLEAWQNNIINHYKAIVSESDD